MVLKLSSIILSYLAFTLGVAMADEPISGIGMLNQFKTLINYSAIKAQISEDTKVVANWPSVLKELQVTKKEIWKSYDNSSWLQGDGHAVISGYIEYPPKVVSFKIHVFSGIQNKQVLDQLLGMLAMTSSMTINYNHSENSQCDLCLYIPYALNKDSYKKVKCVFRNVIVEASAAGGDADVRPVVESLVGIMGGALVDNSKIQEIKYKVVSPVGHVKMSDEFLVDVGFPENVNEDDYDIVLQDDMLPEGLEYVRNMGSEYYLKADRKGVFSFDIWLMDKQTLLTKSTNIVVNAE